MAMKRTDSFVAMMPLGKMGNSDWDWFGASLSKTMGEKLIIAGLTVVPYYELGHIPDPIETSLLMNWEKLIRMSEFLESGQIVTGSYQLDEKRILINLYAVQRTGLSLLARGEDSRDNFVALLDRICQELVPIYGRAVNAQIRERMESITATTNLEAYQAMVTALQAWAMGNLEAVRESAQRAQALDPNFHDPLDILARATRQLGNTKQQRDAYKAQLTHLMTSELAFKALAIIDDILACAREMGDKELEDDCRKVESTIARSSGTRAYSRVFYARAQALEDEQEALLEESNRRQAQKLLSPNWNIGQIVALYLMADSWLQQAEVNFKLGYYAPARHAAFDAAKLFQVLHSSPQRQRVRKLLDEIDVALSAA